mmetsp:Transcript_10225/g.21531  ORF Transcript_10225/g.21531 Transcript_10225/m.21531 type:complete len:117 (-) Transcript_10225:294-644(-)
MPWHTLRCPGVAACVKAMAGPRGKNYGRIYRFYGSLTIGNKRINPPTMQHWSFKWSYGCAQYAWGIPGWPRNIHFRNIRKLPSSGWKVVWTEVSRLEFSSLLRPRIKARAARWPIR